MSAKELRRAQVLGRVEVGELNLREASELLEVAYRQGRRLWKRYRQKGAAGLVHGLRGQPSNHQAKPAFREAVVAAYTRHYPGWNLIHATQFLERKQKLRVSPSSLRRWLQAAGAWQERKRGAVHRRRRLRKACAGELVQLDGSPHAWFGPTQPACVLMEMVDDATSRSYARLVPAETTEAAMATFWGYVRQYGLPQALYVDRDSIYQVNPATRAATTRETLENTGPLTQFGRAMRALDVRVICAHSPQAKGRVERRHGLCQDRLVKELAQAGITEIAAANRYLEQCFLPDVNARFTVAPADRTDLHRKLSQALPRGQKLEDILALEDRRVLSADWCVRWANRWFQVEATHRRAVRPGSRILVRQKLDGTVDLVYQGVKLTWTELASPPRREPPRVTLVQHVAELTGPAQPKAEHPWRQAWRDGPGTSRPRGSNGSAPASLRSPPRNRSTPAETPPQRTFLLNR